MVRDLRTHALKRRCLHERLSAVTVRHRVVCMCVRVRGVRVRLRHLCLGFVSHQDEPVRMQGCLVVVCAWDVRVVVTKRTAARVCVCVCVSQTGS